MLKSLGAHNGWPLELAIGGHLWPMMMAACSLTRRDAADATTDLHMDVAVVVHKTTRRDTFRPLKAAYPASSFCTSFSPIFGSCRCGVSRRGHSNNPVLCLLFIPLSVISCLKPLPGHHNKAAAWLHWSWCARSAHCQPHRIRVSKGTCMSSG